MSKLPQKGGSHSSTGGARRPVPASAPVIDSTPICPSFAIVCLDFGASEACGSMIIAGSHYPIHIEAVSNARRVPVACESAQNPRGQTAQMLHLVCLNGLRMSCHSSVHVARI